MTQKTKFENELNRAMTEMYLARKKELVAELREINEQLDKLGMVIKFAKGKSSKALCNLKL